MAVTLRFAPLVALLLGLYGGAGTARSEETAAPVSRAAAVEYFEKHIRPLLVDNCYTCHSADTNSHGGLRVDDRNGLLQGGNGGPAIVPGHPEKSRLILAVSYGDKKLQMPPKKQLSAEQVSLLTKWIADGAAWPEVAVPEDLVKPVADYDQLRKSHWAWQPLTRVPPPAVEDADWPRTDIDRFVLAKLGSKRLPPTTDADRVTLLRRVTFDLVGLPPAPEDVDDFLADSSPDAFDKVVDRLLASPAFGERWGRHWLDVARYGESTGSSRNVPYPHAWRYRDYVIDSVNRDKPYDVFVREQIAGDLLPADTQSQRDEQTVATGFLALGVKDVNQRFRVRFVMDNIDEQIDTVCRSFLALTASCARCHNHKFDPIPATDYYALAGIFQSSELCAGVRNKMGGGGLDYYDTQMLLALGGSAGVDPVIAAKIEETKQALAEARKELASLRNDLEKNSKGDEGEEKLKAAREKVNKIQSELVNLSDPAMQGPVAFGVREAKEISDASLRVRGEAEKIGPVVPRGFLTLVPGSPPAVPTSQSGRLELSQWLTSDGNPLTPRVMVNRVWRHLFDQGLVSTVDNFGTTGDIPSHPELLDYLALRFRNDGWSVKKLVRAIVLSRTYQLSADATDAGMTLDPAGKLLWRHRPRRLDAEEIRDAMLAAAGRLDQHPPAESPASRMKVIELNNDGGEAKRLEQAARGSQKRSVYLPLVRGITPTSLAIFDFAEQGMVTGSRDVTTVAPQALYLLNDPFVRRQATSVAQRLLCDPSLDEASRLTSAYRLTLGRAPLSHELERARLYLKEYEAALRTETGTIVAVAETTPPSTVSSGDEKSQDTTQAAPAKLDESQRQEQAPPLDPRTAAWTSLCQALFGSAEFRYVR